MPSTVPPATEPRRDLVARGCDYIDLRSNFIRVTRQKAEEILSTWVRANDLTGLERRLILNRYDPQS
jgi:hypothetical protein